MKFGFEWGNKNNEGVGVLDPAEKEESFVAEEQGEAGISDWKEELRELRRIQNDPDKTLEEAQEQRIRELMAIENEQKTGISEEERKRDNERFVELSLKQSDNTISLEESVEIKDLYGKIEANKKKGF